MIKGINNVRQKPNLKGSLPCLLSKSNDLLGPVSGGLVKESKEKGQSRR